MAKPERLEDLGKVAYILDSIYHEDLLFCKSDMSEEDFISTYCSPNKIEELYHDLNMLARKIEKMDDILNGDAE